MIGEMQKLKEHIEVSLEVAKEDITKQKKIRTEIVKQIYGKKHTGEWSVREVMNKIIGKTVTDDEFDKYYPLYTLGYQTGRCVGLASKKETLKFLLVYFRPKKAKVKENEGN